MGETSGGAIRALSLGQPLIVSDVDAYARAPGRRRAQGRRSDEREVESLASALLLLADDHADRDAFSKAATSYASSEHGLEHVADLYVRAFEEAAGGAAVREQLLREVAQSAADVGLDDSEAIGTALREVGLGR